MNKPILKWVGGKTQIIDKILSKFPEKINTYHEIFLGGGSVLIALLSSDKIKTQHVFAYDINESLIGVYKNVQTKPQELYNVLTELVQNFMSFPTAGVVNRKPESKVDVTCRETYYYWIRKCYNQEEDHYSVQNSAYFIFLNKTCFRGLHRNGPNGFNVPYGNYKNPTIIDRDHLFHIHTLIQNATFECLDFEQSMSRVTDEDDFVYLDPPYVPVTTTSFVSYDKDRFDKHDVLFDLCKKLPCPFLMSNSNTEKVKTSFQNYVCKEIETRCSINPKNPDAKQSEIMIYSEILTADL
jgi:DNA adenine methylase